MSSAIPSASSPATISALVDQIIALLGASHTTKVRGKTLREVLIDDVSLAPAPDSLFELISYLTGGAQREKARALAQGEDPDGDAATLDVMAVLQKFSDVRPHPEAFVEALEPLQPRLYSISSSHNATPGKLSLTVDCVRYVINKRKRLGLASTFLAERINPGDELKVYVQKAHGFALPQDPKTPIIMIGPGTGVAPFRAFLLDRRATGAPGKNWLFFGHQRSDCDFFYADELNAMKTSGLLTRLSLAWSRDGDKKFYVQDRMREVGREVWTWLAEGANVYICGDAKRMAKDVERALVDIVAQFGARSTDEAVGFVGGTQEEGPVPAGRLLIPGSNWLKSAPNKILGRIGRGEFSTRNGVRRSVRIAISAAILHRGANDIPYAAHAALEIDHARTIGGSPPAPLRTLGVPPIRHRLSYRRALQRVRAHCGHRVRHAVGSPVLKLRLRRAGPTQRILTWSACSCRSCRPS